MTVSRVARSFKRGRSVTVHHRKKQRGEVVLRAYRMATIKYPLPPVRRTNK